jgi:hypothetical protein
MKRAVKPLLGAVAVCLLLTAAWFAGSSQPQSESLPSSSSVDVCADSQDSSATGVSSLVADAEEDSSAASSAPPADSEAPDASTALPSTAAATEKPEAAPHAAPVTDAQWICTISIDCQTILARPELLPPEKSDLVPADGILLDSTTVAVSEGDTVFDVLERIAREKKIHLEFDMTPAYQSVYIEGIGNLYEFDCGDLSGWTYSVNDIFSPTSCSQISVKNGDRIRWCYTCDLGSDVGAPEG